MFAQTTLVKTETGALVQPYYRESAAMIVRYQKFLGLGPKKQKSISALQAHLESQKLPIAKNFERTNGGPARLSKHLAELCIFSRNQADDIIKSGIFYVDGKRVTDPTLVVDKANSLRILFPPKFDVPLPSNLKLWLYHKPIGMTASHDDPKVPSRLRPIGAHLDLQVAAHQGLLQRPALSSRIAAFCLIRRM